MIKEWHSLHCLYTVIKILNPTQLCVEDRQVFQIFVFFWRYSDHYFLLDLGNRDRIRNKNLITATFISIFDGKLILNSWSSLLPLGTSVTWLTKIRILKNRNLRRKADRSFRGNSLKNHFRHLNLYSNPQSWWLEVVVIWAPLERQKVELHIFERANFSDFATWKFTSKEHWIPRKQVFVLNSGSYVLLWSS